MQVEISSGLVWHVSPFEQTESGLQVAPVAPRSGPRPPPPPPLLPPAATLSDTAIGPCSIWSLTPDGQQSDPLLLPAPPVAAPPPPLSSLLHVLVVESHVSPTWQLKSTPIRQRVPPSWPPQVVSVPEALVLQTCPFEHLESVLHVSPTPRPSQELELGGCLHDPLTHNPPQEPPGHPCTWHPPFAGSQLGSHLPAQEH